MQPMAVVTVLMHERDCAVAWQLSLERLGDACCAPQERREVGFFTGAICCAKEAKGADVFLCTIAQKVGDVVDRSLCAASRAPH